MIVACSACSARFRVADEKVGPRGARIRCTRCGQTFAVSPAPPPTPVPAAPPEPPATTSEATGTGGWPTGILEVPGTPAADIGTPLAMSLEGDPFATFAGAATGSGFPASRSVTNLSDLERTGAVPIAARNPLEPDTFRDGGLSLEEGTKAAMPLRDGTPRWDEPEATSAVAVGPDGFQEVDLAAGAAPPDPDFDPLDPEPTPAAPVQRPPPREPTPPVVALAAAPASPDRPPAPAQPRAPRFRALAMNVLSLAALLIVTAGILVWWRGEGIGSILRWPGSARQRDVEIGQVSSGEYQGARGLPVLFVRGVVRATRAPVEGPVAVRVELVRAGATVGAATGAAGALPSPDQLAGIASAEDLGRMRAELLPSAPARLEPGKDLPFLVILLRPEGDVGAIRFRVEPVLSPGR
jgi:predicted Zn finger-like uncharacterized protein